MKETLAILFGIATRAHPMLWLVTIPVAVALFVAALCAYVMFRIMCACFGNFRG